MRAVVQRVAKASVMVNDEIVGKIGRGLLILLGVGEDDSEDDIVWMANKIAGLRIFPDKEEKMNLSAIDLKLDVLVVSQFTLYGTVKKGFRPSFTSSAPPEKGEQYYEKLVKEIEKFGLHVEKGVFGAMMDVELVNQGPVTILIDSKKEY